MIPIPRDELLSVLNELLEAERAGVRVCAEYQESFAEGPARTLLAAVSTDEARSCALLSKAIDEIGGSASHRTGAFAERALTVSGDAERLAFLNRGQRWVVRRLEATLPRVDDPKIATWLREMLDIHVRNILACEEELEATGE